MGRGKAYSQDLRIRAIYLANKYNLGRTEIKSDLKMDSRTIQNYIKYLRLRGDTTSFAQMFGRKPRSKSYDKDDLREFISILSKFGGLRIYQMRHYLYVATGKLFRRSTTIRMLCEILHTRKKAAVRATESDYVQVTLHYLGCLALDRDRMHFGDESHISNKNGAIEYGWSPQGQSCIIEDVFVRKFRSSVIGIVSIRGMLCHAAKYGSINGVQYRYFMYFYGIAVLCEGDHLFMDNASIHKDQIICRVILFLGIDLRWLPAYSAFSNPLEIIWNGMKMKMKSPELREITKIDPIRACDMALAPYYNKDLSSIYKQCGY